MDATLPTVNADPVPVSPGECTPGPRHSRTRKSMRGFAGRMSRDVRHGRPADQVVHGGEYFPNHVAVRLRHGRHLRRQGKARGTAPLCSRCGVKF